MTDVTLAPTTSALTLTLTDVERAEFGRLAGLLADTAPGLVDDPAWVDAARLLSCQLPVRLRETIRRYRHDSGVDGLLIVNNLPVDVAALPATPTVPESVERAATVPAGIAAMMALHIGEILAYREEKTGALVQNVVPVPGREESQSNAGSTPLELHVENAFHPHRPDFVGLLCLRNDHSGTAGTLVSSIRRALRLVPDQVRDVLLQPRFVTEPPPSFAAGDATPVHAVLDGDPADPNVRVDFTATQPLDDEGKLALDQLRDAFIEVASSLVLQSGEMAFVDNRIAIHGRSAFTPRYDGHDRWLHRTFVHLDNRRTRAHRPNNGHVLS
ncbi:clavaminate synthase [Solihabitans fulvus]|uniref:Clavaminate synthase n=1 Tax=Solihabitans fulvus TaxID=1892852 RepID=A0A5B2X327_9PSEU|nr:TauD/TfdA family dioxygenase [Solihabitans fulvus]KAA2257585.1 clavaminate synthase [Solihabitans fulvus]